jgi:hypothetical protein
VRKEKWSSDEVQGEYVPRKEKKQEDNEQLKKRIRAGDTHEK